ncbi:MAG: PEP-CTERM sorting domain-containing protein [Desulfobacula sp.]|nr:PEP-CTERM sorting domain-containing protein [Desulfobacula sp.]
MKKFFMFLLFLLICGSFGIAGAAPMYYTFNGTITNINNTYGFIGTDLSVGDSVEQVWTVDLEASGYIDNNAGTTTTKVDSGVFDWFYVDFFSGLNLDLSGAGYYDAATNVSQYNAGHTISKDYSDSDVFTTDQTYFIGDSQSEQIWLANFSTLISDWTTGMGNFWSYQFLAPAGADGAYDSWYSKNMVLTSITAEVPADNPVPEPATMLLFGLGLLGLAGVNRRQK